MKKNSSKAAKKGSGSASKNIRKSMIVLVTIILFLSSIAAVSVIYQAENKKQSGNLVTVEITGMEGVGGL